MVWEGLGLLASTSLEGKAGNQPYSKWDEDRVCLHHPKGEDAHENWYVFSFFFMSPQQELSSNILSIHLWIYQFLLMSFGEELWI